MSIQKNWPLLESLKNMLILGSLIVHNSKINVIIIKKMENNWQVLMCKWTEKCYWCAYLRCKNLNAGEFNIPAEFRDGPPNATEGIGVINHITQVLVVVGGFVQPHRGPQQLILVPTHWCVVVFHHSNAFIVFPSVLIPKFE